MKIRTTATIVATTIYTVVICAGAILAVEAAAHSYTAVSQAVVDLGSGKYMPTGDPVVSATA